MCRRLHHVTYTLILDLEQNFAVSAVFERWVSFPERREHFYRFDFGSANRGQGTS